ncbi:MAG: ribonuclease III [Flavobacteriales bacterium]|nr:ribonuclease III [Flavobacteriales bacterium]
MNFLKKIFNSRSSKNCGNFSYYKELTGFTPHRVEYYEAAFTHKSVTCRDKNGNKINYERLEFLGDAVLGCAIADYLFTRAPRGNEGYLTQMRSKIVSRAQLNIIGKNLHLEQKIKCAFGDVQIPDAVYGDTMEALIGAIYLDRGYDKCKKFLHRVIITPYVDIKTLEHKVSSYKGLLVEWAQKTKKTLSFEVCDTKDDDLEQQFGIKLILDGVCVSKGRGTSKKKAEEQASKRAYYQLRYKIDNKK